MLERAAGCVETAGRRFLRDPNGAIRTRRALPRRFWRHNGAAGDIAHWLRALVHPQGQPRSFIHNPAQEVTSAHDGSPPFLDFLYPQEIREVAASRLSRHPKRPVSRRRKRSLASLSRTYSSNASHLESILIPELEAQTPDLPDHIDARKQAFDDLTELIEQHGVDYDKAWVLYIASGNLPASQIGIQSSLCAYLSRSPKSVDHDRAWEVFEAIPPESRSARDFLAITRSQIQCDDSSKLKSICEQASAKGFGDACCALSFSYHVKRQNWNDAMAVWDLRSRPGEHSSRPQPQTLLSELKDNMIPEHTVSLGTFLASRPNNIDAIELAQFLLHQISTSLHVLENTSIAMLSQILARYHDMDLLRPKHYFDMISTLQASHQRQTFVWSIVAYQSLRSQMPDAKPPKKLLGRQVDRLVFFQVTSAIPFFLDQIVHFWQKPSLEVYKQAMIAFSRIGDIAQVKSFFDRLVADHGKPRSRRLLTPLLFVYARSGNVQETLHQFNRVSEEFHLQPSVACWNILLVAYAVSADSAGAVSTFKQMREIGLPPDSYTFAKLMSLCAQRGDIDSVRQLLKEAQSSQVQITMQILEKIVQVYAKIGLLNLAEDFAVACLNSDAKGSPMRMLNGLLMQYALRVDTQSFERVLQQMKLHGIPPDATTHAASMLRLALVGKPDQARLTLRRLHKKRMLHATEYHYAIVLWGYVRIRNLDMVDIISREIVQRFGNSGITSSLLDLKTEVQRDLESPEHESTMDGMDLRLMDAEKQLLDTITTHGAGKAPSHTAPVTPANHQSDNRLRVPHYAYLIREYGARGAVEQARALFQEFIDNNLTSSSQADGDGSLPIRLATEMMHVYLKAGQYEQVEECWQRVLPSAVKMASRINVEDLFASQPRKGNFPSIVPTDQHRLPSSEHLAGSQEDSVNLSADSPLPPPQKPDILPSQQFILSRPFSIYLRALAYQSDLDRVLQAVNEFKAIGFAVSTFNMSTVVQMLASSDKFTDLVEAFRIYEVDFMPHWPGWRRLERGSGLKPAGVPRGIAALDDPRTRRSSQQFLGRRARKHWSGIAPGFMQPTYVSMVYLAAALNRIRATSIVNGSDELATLFEIAPNTTEQVGKLRYLREKFQGVLIRFRSNQPETERWTRPPSHAVAPGGILGTGRHAQRRLDIWDYEPHGTTADSTPLAEETEWNAQLQRDDLDLGMLDSPLTPEDRMDLEHELTSYRRQLQGQHQKEQNRRERRARRKQLRDQHNADHIEVWDELEEHAVVAGDPEAEHEEAFDEVSDTPEAKPH